jgi:hypothetical protein
MRMECSDARPQKTENNRIPISMRVMESVMITLERHVALMEEVANCTQFGQKT